MAARPARRAAARGGEQVVLAHQPQHPAPGGAGATMAQPGPDLAMPLAMEGAGGQHRPDRLQEVGIWHRSPRPGGRGGVDGAGARCDRGSSGQLPDRHTHYTVGPAAHRRDRPAHGFDRRRAKGRPASRAAIFSCSRSRSIKASPRAFSRSAASAAPLHVRVARLPRRRPGRHHATRQAPRSRPTHVKPFRDPHLAGAAAPLQSCAAATSARPDQGHLAWFAVSDVIIHLCCRPRSAYEVSHSSVLRGTCRFIGKAEGGTTMLQDWAYAVPYRSSDNHNRQLPIWRHHYGCDRQAVCGVGWECGARAAARPPGGRRRRALRTAADASMVLHRGRRPGARERQSIGRTVIRRSFWAIEAGYDGFWLRSRLAAEGIT